MLLLLDLLLLLQLVFQTLHTQQTNAQQLRVVVGDWISNMGDETSLQMPLVYARVEANFFVAAHHFNERREDIYPSLALIRGCEKNVTIVNFCDESGSPLRVSQIVNEMAPLVDAFVGFSSLPGTQSLTYEASVFPPNGRIEMSHWTSAQRLGISSEFPLFSRVVVADDDYSLALSHLIAELGFTQAAILYMNSDTGPVLKDTLLLTLQSLNVITTGFSFTYGDAGSILQAMRRIKESRIGLIVLVCYVDDLTIRIADSAAALGMLTSDYQYILTNFDVIPSPSDALNSMNTSMLLQGSFAVVDDNRFTDLFQSYVNQWDSFLPLLPWINGKMPPQGTHDAFFTSCINDAANYTQPDELFSNSDSAQSVWAHAYDALMATAIASCIADPGPNVASAEQFHQTLLELDFEGFSGRIRFLQNGNRNPADVAITALNWAPLSPNDNIASVAPNSQLFGVFDFNYKNWNFSMSSYSPLQPFTTKKGFQVIPTSFVPAVVDYQLLPQGLKYLGYAEVTLSLFLTVSLVGFMFVKRMDRVVVRHQGILLCVALLGLGCISSWTILALTVDGSDSDHINPISACAFGPFLFFAGAYIAEAALTARSFRVYLTFKNNASSHVQVPLHRVLKWVVFSLAPLFSALIGWTAGQPLAWGVFVDRTDLLGTPVLEHGECYSDESIVTSAGAGFLVVLHFLGLITMWIAHQYASSCAPLDFYEVRLYGLVSSLLLEAFVLCAAVTAAVYTSPIARFVVLSTYIFVSLLGVAGLVAFPVVVEAFDFASSAKTGQKVDPEAIYGAESVTLDKEKLDVVRSYLPEQSLSEITVADALRLETTRIKFKAFADESGVFEEYCFVVDVLHWKDLVEESGEDHQGVKVMEFGLGIAKTYLKDGAWMQIAVDSQVRQNCLKLVLLKDPHAFDAAFQATVASLETGAWNDFKKQGGMFAVALSNKRRPDAAKSRKLDPNSVRLREAAASQRVKTSSKPSSLEIQTLEPLQKAAVTAKASVPVQEESDV